MNKDLREYAVITENFGYHCVGLADLKRKIKALKLLDIEFEIYYKQDEAVTRMLLDPESILD